MSDEIAAILRILLRVRSYLYQPGVDVNWSTYESPAEAIRDLNDQLAKLTFGDLSGLRDLEFQFLPTSDFQEIAISSGWSAAYLKLAADFDRAAAALTNG